MAAITQIVEPRGRPQRRRIYLDGQFAFSVKLNVVAKFRLREGMELSAQQIEAIEQGEIRQECLDRAMKQAERLRKLDPQVARRRLAGMLARRGFDYDAIRPVIDEVLGDGR